MTCPACYVNSTPEHVPVTINNNSIALDIDDAAVSWVVDQFGLTDSVGDLGLTFFLSKPGVLASEVQVWVDNVNQDPVASFSVPASLDRVTLAFALTEGQQIRIRYLAYVTSDTWANETLYLANSSGGLGLVFTLANTPLDSSHIVVLNDGSALTYTAGVPTGTQFTFSGTTLTLGTALAAGKPLVVTYAH